MITYTNSNDSNVLQQIVDLQTANLLTSLSAEEAKEQGFVTIQHDVAILQTMGEKYPHTIAKDGDTVVGYALSMPVEFRNDIPVITPMFDAVDTIKWKSKLISEVAYIAVGQVCIAKAYRGQGIFRGLYQQMVKFMQPHFDLLVTDIVDRNTRSLGAHKKMGFVVLDKFTYASSGDTWIIVGKEI